MSARTYSDAVRGLGRNALDLQVAALAALAFAFAIFAMPPDLLSQLVGSTGLPQWLPAAEPPLGNKARIGVGGAGAILIFAFVFGLLRLLDRSGRAARAEETAQEEEPPRLRRRDFHPDAPARRPLSATELGEPDPVETPDPVEPEAAAEPLWLSPAETGDIAVPAEPDEQVEACPAPSFEPAPVDPESILETAPEPVVRPDPDRAAAPVPEPSEEAGHRSDSIPDLMRRLERGLARRQPVAQGAAAPSAMPPAEPMPGPAAGDDRLQSAIDSLQRLASRQG